MAGIEDFRSYPFTRSRVDDCGRFLGHRSYWKLYSIENYLRVILHSILTVQIDALWWDSVVDPPIRKSILQLKRAYLKKPVHTSPGPHDIYYVYLSDLTKIMAATRHLLIKIITDVDDWIVKFEEVRIPRNLISHMNFPNATDRKRIDGLYEDLVGLVRQLEKRPGLKIKIP